jgi:hypothetical protein
LAGTLITAGNLVESIAHVDIRRPDAPDEPARSPFCDNFLQNLDIEIPLHHQTLYPALAKVDEKGHATKAFTEQSAATMQLGLLQYLPPMSQEFLDEFEHVRGAVAHHVYEEESNWLLDLKRKTPAADQVKLTNRYQEQFARYMGDDSDI